MEQETIQSLVKEFEEKTFIHLKHCNYTEAVKQFFAARDIILEKQDIVEGEKVSYIDQYGVFKYKNTIKIKSMNVKMQISCFHQKDWEFQFDALLPTHLPIEEERVIRLNEALVFVMYQNEEKQKQFYAVPLSLAEQLDLEEFHEKQMDQELKVDVLSALEPYKVNKMLHLKF